MQAAETPQFIDHDQEFLNTALKATIEELYSPRLTDSETELVQCIVDAKRPGHPYDGYALELCGRQPGLSEKQKDFVRLFRKQHVWNRHISDSQKKLEKVKTTAEEAKIEQEEYVQKVIRNKAPERWFDPLVSFVTPKPKKPDLYVLDIALREAEAAEATINTQYPSHELHLAQVICKKARDAKCSAMWQSIHEQIEEGSFNPSNPLLFSMAKEKCSVYRHNHPLLMPIARKKSVKDCQDTLKKNEEGLAKTQKKLENEHPLLDLYVKYGTAMLDEAARQNGGEDLSWMPKAVARHTLQAEKARTAKQARQAEEEKARATEQNPKSELPA